MSKSDESTVCVLSSGGMDSSACIYFYLKLKLRVRPLFVDYGQPAKLAELRSAKKLAEFYELPLRTVRFSGAKIDLSGEIAGRNSLLISAALVKASKKTTLIALGVHAGTRYFDCSPRFIELWETLLSGYTDGRIRIGVPFLNWNKTDISAYCKENHIPVHLTWSCESRSDVPCGECASCCDRK